MKNGIIALALLATLSACVSAGTSPNLAARSGPQTISPTDTSATNPTKLQGGFVN